MTGRASDLPDFMKRVSYRVERRSDTSFAVMRHGVRNGKRLIDVYDNAATAELVCSALNGAALHVR